MEEGGAVEVTAELASWLAAYRVLPAQEHSTAETVTIDEDIWADFQNGTVRRVTPRNRK